MSGKTRSLMRTIGFGHLHLSRYASLRLDDTRYPTTTYRTATCSKILWNI